MNGKKMTDEPKTPQKWGAPSYSLEQVDLAILKNRYYKAVKKFFDQPLVVKGEIKKGNE